MQASPAGPRATGQCLCGAVRLRIDGPISDAHACHCGQCRRQSGHFVVGTSALRSDVTIEGAGNVQWYRSSPLAERGFCRQCGSVLFWRDGSEKLSFNAGCLDPPTRIKLTHHIFVEDKSDYYEIDDGLPQFIGYDQPKPPG